MPLQGSEKFDYNNFDMDGHRISITVQTRDKKKHNLDELEPKTSYVYVKRSREAVNGASLFTLSSRYNF